MMDARNYDSSMDPYGPFVLYMFDHPNEFVFQQRLDSLAAVGNDLHEKVIMFTSVARFEEVMRGPGPSGHATFGDYLIDEVGVRRAAYNPEAQHTPLDEMQRLLCCTNCGTPPSGYVACEDSNNSVVQFVQIANSFGLPVQWGPVRNFLDAALALAPEAIAAMGAAGLDGFAIQEQRFIEQACPADRTDAVATTVAGYESILGDTTIAMQIMPSRCEDGGCVMEGQCGSVPDGPYGHCVEFADMAEPFYDELAIWAAVPIDTPEDAAALIAALRRLEGYEPAAQVCQ
jgi:hypothetical protein